MYMRMARGVLIIVMGIYICLPVSAEIISLSGFAQARITEYFNSEQRESDEVTGAYPETVAVLPIQVVARLVSPEALAGDLTEEAAASVGAQFADPRTVTTPNPEEFAINLALHGISPHIHYTAHAVTRETRGVKYSAGELGIFSREGDEVTLTGRLFIDGVLTLFSTATNRDLTGAYVRLNIRVIQRVEEGEDQTAFTGSVELRGTAEGAVEVSAEGDFPTNRLILSDLSVLMPRFDVFRVLVMPNLTINYNFVAVVGQEFTLEASVEIEAANLPDEVGAAAILGTPTDSLTKVIDLTLDTQTADEFVSKLNAERANPSGESAFPTAGGWPFLPVCGLLGFESALGLIALAGMRGTAGRMFAIRK